MPLIQTFGHMEFALKNKKFEHLRENPLKPDSICPSSSESLDLIEHMLTQVIEIHSPPDKDALSWPNLTHIHIGCDEVFNMRQCSKCKSKSKHDLFLSHVKSVIGIVHKKSPNLKVVMWDDMMRSLPLELLQSSQLGQLVEPMIWIYSANVNQHFSKLMWDKFASVFSTVWTASAFKGASGYVNGFCSLFDLVFQTKTNEFDIFSMKSILPPLRMHVNNHLKWADVINDHSSQFKEGIQGIALTGWQRYNHFLELCELLPIAIPSLALCLSALRLGYFETNHNKTSIFSTMSCPQPNNSTIGSLFHTRNNEQTALDYKPFTKCLFPGYKAMLFSLDLHSIVGETHDFFIDNYKKYDYVSAYAMKYEFASRDGVEQTLTKAEQLDGKLNTLQLRAESALSECYDAYTINEIIEQKITYLRAKLNKIKENANYLTSVKVWPRRPFDKDNIKRERRQSKPKKVEKLNTIMLTLD